MYTAISAPISACTSNIVSLEYAVSGEKCYVYYQRLISCYIAVTTTIITTTKASHLILFAVLSHNCILKAFICHLPFFVGCTQIKAKLHNCFVFLSYAAFSYTFCASIFFCCAFGFAKLRLECIIT